MRSFPQPHPLPSGRHGYLAIEGLVALGDLLPLPVAPGSDQLQDGLLVTAWRKGGHPAPDPTCLQEAHQGCALQSWALAFCSQGVASQGGSMGPIKPPLRGLVAQTVCELRGPVIQLPITQIRKLRLGIGGGQGLTPRLTKSLA